MSPNNDQIEDPREDQREDQREPRKSAAIGSGFAEQALGTIADRAIMGRLWRYMRPYGRTFLLSLLLLPIISGVQLLQPHILQIAIDEYMVPGQLEGFGWIVAAFAAAVFGQGFFQFLQFYLMQYAGQRALRDVRQEAFDHVQTLPVSFFHRNPVGRLMTRMTTDVESIQEALSSGMITMIGDILTLTGIVVILLYKSWELALVSFAVVPLLLGLTAIFRHFMRKAYRLIRVKIARLNAHLQESVTGMNIIQLFVREQVSAAEYEEINADYRDANLLSIRYDAMLYAVVEAVGSVTVGVIIWYGSGQVLRDVVTIGVLVAFIEYMQKFFVPIRDLAQKYNLLQSALASSERIFQLLDEDEVVPRPENPTPIADGPLSIEFRGVWFAYNREDWVLRDVSFRIESCERVALVGHTGAGKTTIINLLMRLHDVTRGEILVNGVDIRNYDLQEYREHFAIVLQDVFLFQGTIRQNIDLGHPDIDDSAVREAAAAVHADQLIARYADGYEHRVAERGSNLSAGEKQLMAFARALAHDPDMLILDEATANVDTDTEALIQDAVDVLMRHQTSVVIAHRLSTIQRADRILVMHKGCVLETGTHEELMERGGHYHTLVRLQYAVSTAAE